MTDDHTDTAVRTPSASGHFDAPDPYPVEVTATQGGALDHLEVDGCSVLLYPADALADGLAGLWLRRRGPEGLSIVSLVGQLAMTHAIDPVDPTTRAGRWRDLEVLVTLRRSRRQAAWYWHVGIANHAAVAVELDLVTTQDVALASRAAVRTNEFYLSQYLDLTPVQVPGHGVALGVRQNMPGPTPWLLVGCLGTATGWATDAIQLTGRGRPEGTIWPGLRHDLPNSRVQGEHTAAVLQTAPITVQPGGRIDTGFYGLVVADHPAATTDADAAFAVAVLSDPAALPPDPPAAHPLAAAVPVRAGDHRSLFGIAPTLVCRPLTVDELDRLGGTSCHQVEQVEGTLLSFFTADGAQVVTAAKQALVLRPHGHLLRSGTSLLPEETNVTATVWMDGTFCSQLTQGHVNAGTIMSLRRSYLGLAPAHGLRLFVRRAGTVDTADPVDAADPTGGWTLLGTPSAWRVALDGCRWVYAAAEGVIEVETELAADQDRVVIRVEVIDGGPIELRAALHLPWLDPDAAPGRVTVEPHSVRVIPPDAGRTAELHPDASVVIGWTPDSAPLVADDGPLFVDATSRGLPWVTLTTAPCRSWELVVTPQLVPTASQLSPSTDFWPTTAAAITITPPDTTAGAELGRIATVVPWFTHDALVHYLSPRGLEQYSGGAWGTRDVSQGPVGLLLALGAHAELRQLLLIVMRAQHRRGDWPQAFEFLDRHRHGGSQGAESGAHGDVVYWPLLALGQYLAATGDHSVLTERITSVGDHGDTIATSVAEHVAAALAHIESTMISGTHLPAYGHGDWNDSLQPVDPGLAAQMCSSWTVVLQAQSLGTLGHQLLRAVGTQELGQRLVTLADHGVADLRRLLLVDGVLAGYGVFTGAGVVETLIHPRDDRTGLTYSLLPMIHAIAGELFTPAEARQHLQLITDHLHGPDGAHLFDRPVGYTGGPMALFQRAEASTFFGREIGIMYMHAHLRYAEALARVGDGPALLRALALAQPIGMTDRVANARPRQSTCYYSSSDAAFPDRYVAAQRYGDVLDGQVPVEGGWRVYSSGPGLFLQLLVECLLGVRARGDRVELDPVLDAGLDGLSVELTVAGVRRTVRYLVGDLGHGVTEVRLGGSVLSTQPLTNRYRSGGVSVSRSDLAATGARMATDGGQETLVLEIMTR